MDSKEILKGHVTHSEDNSNFDRSWRDEQWGQKSLSGEAQDQYMDEKELGPRDAIRAYPKAILWSLVFSTCVIMEGYDTNLPGNFYAYPSFQIKYGRFVGKTPQTPPGYQLTAAWQAGIGNASGIGSFFGTLPSTGNAPLPMEEITFLQLRPGDRSVLGLEDSSRFSLLTQVIKLNAILIDINAINELAVSTEQHAYLDYKSVEDVSRRLEKWKRNIPDEMQDTPSNLSRYASHGLGRLFVAVYLWYYNYGQMLYYQFLHRDISDPKPRVQAYAKKCKANATNLCEILYRSDDTPDCEVLYSMVGHVLVIASTIQLHVLLFDTDQMQVQATRSRLERNFKIITRLQSFWPSLDMSFSRFQEFHKACQRSTETSFRMDEWMLKFLFEFARPIGEKDVVQFPTMESLGLTA